MREIGPGARGIAVQLAQRLLNRRMGGAMSADESGEFSERMRRVLAEFQKRERITTERDMIGSRSWAALGLRIEFAHPLALIPQADEDGSWAAAAAMAMYLPSALGLSGIVPPPGFDLGGLSTLRSMEMLATRYFWKAMPAPPSAGELLFHAAGRPAWLAGSLDSGRHHAVAVAGAFGDGANDTTFLQILDPGPVGVGSTYYTLYSGSIGTGEGVFTPRALAVP
jgi:hypothetical protein